MCVNMIPFSQPGFMGSKVQWNTTVHDKEDGYRRPSFCRRSLLPPMFSTILCFIRNHQFNWVFYYYHVCVHIRYRWTDLCRRQPIWVDRVGCLAHNNAQMTMWVHQIIMLEIHQAKTLNSGNPQIKFIHHQGIVTRPRSHHFQALPRSTTVHHSTWHQAHNQALVQSNDIRVMGHCGQHMISPKEVTVDFKCSPLSNSQDMGCHLQPHLEYLQHSLKTIQSFDQHLSPLLHQDNFPVHLGDPPLTTQRNNCCRLRNRGGRMLQGLRNFLHYQKFPMTNTM